MCHPYVVQYIFVEMAQLQFHNREMVKFYCGQSAGLTLAQRCGLVDKPPTALSPSEWRHVHEKSKWRGHPYGACPICQEHFADDDQVRPYMYRAILEYLFIQ